MQPKLLQVINRWENVLIETIAISVIFVSAAVTANYFGWPSPDPTVKAAAAVYAYGVDGMFYICVRLARHYLSSSGRKIGWGLFWLMTSALMGAFTWHNNLLFAATSWHISAQALARVGFTDAQELQLHAIIPVAVVMIVAVIPRRHSKDDRTPEQILADAKQEIALMKARNQVRAAKAEVSGQGLRGTIGGFMGQALNLEEKKADDETRQERRHKNAARHDRMVGLAHIHGLDPSADDLEEQLTTLGVWPQNDMSVTSPAMPKATEPATTNAYSGALPTQFTASEIATKIGKPERTVSRWMSPKYKGPYKIHYRFSKSRNARVATASELARIMLLVKGENPPVDVPEEETAQPALEEMPILVVGQPEGQSNGHSNGKSKRQTKSHPASAPESHTEGQDEEIE